jgi:hypothetical protein
MIRTEITIGWQGKDYTTVVDMRLIDRLENQMNLLEFVMQVQAGDVRFSKVATLFAELLKAAGCNVTRDDVFAGMFGNDDVDPASIMPLLMRVFAAIFPPSEKKTTAKATEKS